MVDKKAFSPLQLATRLNPFATSRRGTGSADHLRVLGEISESNARIAERIKDVQSLTEREILACGNALSAIVDKARDLTNESERAAASSVARSDEITARFVRGMREDILAQETAVQRVLVLASGIETAIKAIDGLRMSSKTLALNAKIEAARLGERGNAFGVVADGLSGLSDVIRAATDTVSSAICSVREGLPPVRERAASMHTRTKVFVDEVGEQVKSASQQAGDGHSNGRFDVLMELSNQALSHLQFQDPMAQKLLLIDRELDRAKERVRQLLNGGALEGSDISEVSGGSSEPPPGEIVLF